MSDKLSQLERLTKLLDDGRISESEYTDLKADLLKEPDGEQVVTHSPNDSAEPRPAPTPTPTRAETPTIYKVALGTGIVSIFFGGTFGIIAWATVALGAAALLAEKTAHRRWMAWTGLALGLVFSFMNAYLNGHLDGLFAESPRTSIAAESAVDDSASLGNTTTFIVNYRLSANNPRTRPTTPAEDSLLGDSKIWKFQSGGGALRTWPSTGPMRGVLTMYSESSTDVEDFRARWDLLCRSLPALELSLRHDCAETTMAGLGVVISESDLGIASDDYEAEYLYGGMCWQIWKTSLQDGSVQLLVDAAGHSDSECRRSFES